MPRQVRRDRSLSIGWVAVLMELIAGAVLVSVRNSDDWRYQRLVLLGSFLLWLAGGMAIVLAVWLATEATPTGRGWMPAVGAATIMLILFIVWLMGALVSVDRSGG